jgi:hypothetical protein
MAVAMWADVSGFRPRGTRTRVAGLPDKSDDQGTEGTYAFTTGSDQCDCRRDYRHSRIDRQPHARIRPQAPLAGDPMIVLSVTDLSRISGVTRLTIYREIARGCIEATRVNGGASGCEHVYGICRDEAHRWMRVYTRRQRNHIPHRKDG